MLVLALAGSFLLHAGLIVALLFWPVRDPVEEAGQLGSVALVFADTAAQAGGSAEEQAPPPTPPAPPAAPQPPAPPVQPQVAAPPRPAPSPPMPLAPAPPQAVAPPPAPAAPEAPSDIAALVPDPTGELPAPAPPTEPPPEATRPAPPAAERTTPTAAPAPAPAPAAPVPAPASVPEPAAPAAPPPQPPPRETQQAEAEPLPPPPPPPPPAPPQQQAAAQPTQPRREAPRSAAQAPVRLDAGAGALPEPSMGSFAMGAVVPPGTDPGFRNNPPDYPEAARRRGEEGMVRLNLRVAPDGRVVVAEVTTSSGYAALDNAAVEAARGWRFRPAMRAGVPVAATLTTALHFRLSEAGRR